MLKQCLGFICPSFAYVLQTIQCRLLNACNLDEIQWDILDFSINRCVLALIKLSKILQFFFLVIHLFFFSFHKVSRYQSSMLMNEAYCSALPFSGKEHKI